MFEAVVADLRTFPLEGLTRRELCAVTADIGRVRGALDALEVEVIAAVGALGDSGGDAESMLRSEGRCSKREAKRRVRRAEMLEKMPETTRRLARGEITAEHADDLARAAESVSQAEVDADSTLLGRATARPADMAGRDIRDWVHARRRDSDRREEHRGQRANRSLAIFTGDDGMTVANCRTDSVSGEQMRARIEELARRLYREDGGRGGSDPDRRSWEQLRHDALMILLAGADVAVEGSVRFERDRIAATTDEGRRSDRSPIDLAGGRPVRALSPGVRPVRTQMVVTIPHGVVSGTDHTAVPEIPGTGPLPIATVERLACDAEVFGLILGGDGMPLWHGRARRTTSPQQWRSLLVRDRGCVVCAAHPAHCEAHHLTPWSVGGPTDIDNLALMCVKHHHQLHDDGLLLERDRCGDWSMRPRAGPSAGGSRVARLGRGAWESCGS